MLGEKFGVKSTKMNRTGTGTSIRFGITTAEANRTTATIGFSMDWSDPTNAIVPSVPSSILFMMLSRRWAVAMRCSSEKEGVEVSPFSSM